MIPPLPGDIFQPGQILNNTYEIEGVLGRGGTGEVYRARNTVTGQTVAIKALSKQFSGTEQSLELMRREAEMRDVRDDAVVRYFECSRSDQGHIFLVMDFIDGPSVADLMARRSLDQRELLIIAHRVAQGLLAAHTHGMVHRDLSPDNIILRGGEPDRATLIDFGIAKDTAQGARTIVGNDFAGKYEYASPEQLEGKSETRSDLYSLGATLLAAFRGRVPFEGALPGEMIRRKQSPLDTEGVPEPLKGLIDALTKPKAAERPDSASVVVERLAEMLAPKRGGGREAAARARRAATAVPRGGAAAPKRSGSGLLWIGLVILIAVAGGGAWYSGLVGKMFPTPLPVASPYRLSAASGSDSARAVLSGNAPSSEAAAAIASAFSTATGQPTEASPLTLADGVPSEGWAGSVAELFGNLGGIEGWTVEVSGTEVSISGLASDSATKAEAGTRLDGWAGKGGFDLSLALAAGPRTLAYEAVAPVLAEMADCGRLSAEAPEGGTWGLGDTIRVTGYAAGSETAAGVAARLKEIAGDRQVKVDTSVLNADVCAVRSVVPDAPDDQLSIWFGDGATGAANTTGIFRQGQNPIVEILAPDSLTGLKLTVVVVDNEGKVFSVVPNALDAETSVDALGKVEQGVRRVRVLHSATLAYDYQRPKVFFVTVDPDNFGKQEVFAFLSKDELFNPRRPAEESVESFVKALREAQAAAPGNIVGLAARLLESRP
ncbi:MAG: protein kinase domain-containing protein [Paracoccaceae bacterium]